ncbi:hypothetical protein [Nocardia sp. NPDC020380]|uniref:effector-associated constant component EACC1 n=1 Tax=Nocardia sp. NPDC020380 TaxID=3364309 RepID=UPI003797E6B4
MPESMGQLTIRTSGSTDDLLHLLEWFNGDDELRGRMILPRENIRPGQMGGVADVLEVAVAAGGIGPALAKSLTAWFAHLRSDLSVTVKVDGRAEITVDAKRIKTPEIAAALQDMLGKLDNTP